MKKALLADAEVVPHVIFSHTDDTYRQCPQMECERVSVVDEVGPCSCRLTVEGHIIVRLFGIGRLAERIIIESTHKTLCALPAIVERWRTRLCLLHMQPCTCSALPQLVARQTWQPNIGAFSAASVLSDALLNNACGAQLAVCLVLPTKQEL